MFGVFNSDGDLMAEVRTVAEGTVWVSDYGQEDEQYRIRPM